MFKILSFNFFKVLSPVTFGLFDSNFLECQLVHYFSLLFTNLRMRFNVDHSGLSLGLVSAKSESLMCQAVKSWLQIWHGRVVALSGIWSAQAAVT